MATSDLNNKKRSAEEISRALDEEEELETVLSLWLLKKEKIAKLKEDLKKEERELVELEKEFPIVGNVKGMIRKMAQKKALEDKPAEADQEVLPTAKPIEKKTATTKEKSTKQRLEQRMKVISGKSKKFKNDHSFQGTSHSAPVDTVEKPP